MSNKTVLIAAGGTGGHVFPGLAIAEAFSKQNIHVEWLGTDVGLESRLVPINSIKLHFFPVYGIRGRGLMPILLAPFRVVVSVVKALSILRRVKPDLVMGMGGYVAGPAGMAAYLLRIPLAIHEQNAIPGTTNTLLSKISRLVFSGFPVSLKNVEVVGNPVRESLENLRESKNVSSVVNKQVNVLVVGGSRGSRALNTLLPQAFIDAGVGDNVFIRHQCGGGREQEAEAAYKNSTLDVEILPFIDNMDNAMDWADIMICRAGALTVSEIAVVGLPAILIPYPHAIGDHQTANAEFLVKEGAAFIVQERDFEKGKLSETIKHVLSNKQLIQNMSEAAKRSGICGAATNIVKRCQEIMS